MDHPEYFSTPFLSSSLFGFHSCTASAPDFTWPAAKEDYDLQVYSIREEVESSNIQFMLTSSNSTLPLRLTSDLFYDVYENQKWNFAVRVLPEKVGGDLVTGSTSLSEATYKIEFYGINSDAGVVTNEFYLTSSLLSSAKAAGYIIQPKRIYAGAYRTNFTGNVLQRTDVKLGSVRYWASYLNNEVIRLHSRDPSNYGSLHPYKSTYLYPTDLEGVSIPEMETLALNWGFDSITGSGLEGGYEVPDLSSGSLELAGRYGAIGPIANLQHPGRGDFYVINDKKAVDTRFIYADKQRLPEVLQSSDMVNIEETDNIFTRDSRPIDYYYAIEKSMYQSISDEMINIFGTIVDFNNLIGEPVNRYRSNYKNMEKLRALFFESIENTPDLDRYIEFYKWIDASLDIMLQKLIPASANASEDIRTMVESHILERNKYQNKFPTIEFDLPRLEGGVAGINELLYNWEFGHAPLPSSPLPQNKHCLWWKERAARTTPEISSGDPGVDADRDAILDASLQIFNRSFTTPYRFGVNEAPMIHGGVNYSRNKKIDYVKSTLKFGSSITVVASEIQPPKDCADIYNPSAKLKLDFKATTNETSYLSGKGDIFVPFSLYSSSMDNSGSRTNIHTDTYGSDKDVPMQGPFTADLVGGLQRRHVAPLSATSSLKPTRRMEI